MKYLKLFEYIKGDNFIDWLSMKIGKNIGNFVGNGRESNVYDLSKGTVLKLSHNNFNKLDIIMNKNIDGVAKIYSRGVIIVPKTFLYGDAMKGAKYLNLKGGHETLVENDRKLYYLIMEKVNIDKETIYNLEDVYYWIDGFIRKEVIYDTDENSFRTLFSERNNMDFIQGVYDYIKENSETAQVDLETLSELVSIFRNVSKYFDWKDIHPGQFGRNRKGYLVAFDLGGNIKEDSKENSKEKNIIRESILKFKDF